MADDYVPRMQMEQRLEHLRQDLNKTRIGVALAAAVDLCSLLTKTALVAGALTYFALSCAYGPYDAGKVVYSNLSGDASLKHQHLEEAKWLYAKREGKTVLDERDLNSLYFELGLVNSPEQEPQEQDLSWYRLLEWIESHEPE